MSNSHFVKFAKITLSVGMMIPTLKDSQCGEIGRFPNNE